MKQWLLAVALTCLCSTAKAQSTSLSLPLLGTIDLASFIANSGAIAAYDNHGRKWTGASVRIAWTPADPAQSIADLEVGALWDPITGAPSGITTAIGFRLDNIVSKIDALSAVKKGIGHLPVPSIEVGPFGGYLTATRQWVYGAFIAKKFGG